jgi:serine/threonine-protein kinase HipA
VALVHDQLGAPGLLVRRFDRALEGDHIWSLAVEDACQVLGRWPGDKYVISTEDAIAGLARCCRAPGVASLELFRLLVFAYLSAVYGDRTMALPIGGRIRQQLSWPILRSLSEAIGVPGRLAADVIREQAAAAGTWIGDLDQLPFSANIIRNLRRLVHARIRHIQPEAQQRAH